SAWDWVALAYYGLVVTVLAFVLWARGLAVVPASTAAVFTAVLPLSAVLLSYAILGEAFAWSHVLGAACVIGGIVLLAREPAGAAGFKIARNASLIAGFPVDVCGTTLDRMCGSGQQAANFAAMGVMAGQYDVVIAGGVEHMTRVPMGSNAMGPGEGPLSPRLQERYNIVPQGISAELIAETWGLKREERDEFSAQSDEKAARAIAAGRFSREIVPV